MLVDAGTYSGGPLQEKGQSSTKAKSDHLHVCSLVHIAAQAIKTDTSETGFATNAK
jgi:hypothetical protein